VRHIVFSVLVLAASPAFAQYSNYGYDAAPQQQTYQQPYEQAQYQQPSYQEPLAQSQVNPATGLVNTDYLNLGLGLTQVVDTDQNLLFNAEYRYKDIYYGLRPIAGFHIDDESAIYGYAGFNWDLYLSDHVIFTPTASIGAYSQGDGQDLGHGLEFRTGIELAYELESKSRVGLQLTHLSNAGIGDRNPGTEILQVNYAFPLGWQE